MQRFFMYFLFLWLFPLNVSSTGYPHTWSEDRVRLNSFEVFVDSASFSISKDQTGSVDISESGSGFRFGFDGALQIFNRHSVFAGLDFLSVTTSSGKKSLGHFEQGLSFEASHSSQSDFNIAIGWQLYYFVSKPIDYGYQALTGPFLALSYNSIPFIIYIKYSPVLNSGTMLVSNINTEFVFKLRLDRHHVEQTYLNLELNQIKFYSKLTENTSLSQQTLIGISRTF
jgi:hypothetical protein